MAWSAPMTAVVGAVLTAAQWNATVRDNLLETSVAKATTAGGYFVSTGVNALAERIAGSGTVATAQTSTSTTYTDLATVGPSFAATTGTQAFVTINCRLHNGTANLLTLAGFAVSGATTVAASDNTAIHQQDGSINNRVRAGVRTLVTGLTAGSNTFTMKYRVSGGTGTFGEREIIVEPL